MSNRLKDAAERRRLTARLGRTELPIISCDDCGACCFEQGSPPGYLCLLMQPSEQVDWPDAEDLPRLKTLPEDARAALLDYAADLGDGTVIGEGPCCWLDQKTNRCRWYDWRPQICRDLDVGSEGCRCWRDEYNVDVARLTT